MLLQVGWVMAHPPGLSSMEIQLQADALRVSTTFSLQDIEALLPMDNDLDAEISDEELAVAKPKVMAWVINRLVIGTADTVFAAKALEIQFDEQNNARIDLLYPRPEHRDISLSSELLSLMPIGHQQFVTVRSAEGKPLLEKMLTRADYSLSLQANLEQSSSSATFWSFFTLGIEHILTGYDHLLFLLGLLAVTHRFGAALKIVTFFTLAHSMTLACAGLNVIDLPSSVIEPLIAATIVYVGVENLWCGTQPKGRHWLTFGFGLIHGFGFYRQKDI